MLKTLGIIDMNSIAQVATHQEIIQVAKLSITYNICKSSVFDENWRKWHFCDASLDVVDI